MFKKLGFAGKIEEKLSSIDFEKNELARVIAVHKDKYTVRNHEGTLRAEITGNLRYTASSSLDFPAVGDWVRIAPMDDENAIIIQLLERSSTLERQAVGKYGELQLIAANIDFAYIAMSVNQDFNLKRLDRYLAICNSGNIIPIVLLTKIDLVEPNKLELLMKQVKDRNQGVLVYSLSINHEDSFRQLMNEMEAYKSYCFIGSSGVGKSTIVNYLLGTEQLKTNELSISNQKGKHTTTHRELFILPNESIVVDTPGMREVGLSSDAAGIEATFDEISTLSKSCRFTDCSHTEEVGCAVIVALENGELDDSSYESYLKLKREQQHFSQSALEKKQKDKAFGKMVKSVKSQRRDNKY